MGPAVPIMVALLVGVAGFTGWAIEEQAWIPACMFAAITLCQVGFVIAMFVKAGDD